MCIPSLDRRCRSDRSLRSALTETTLPWGMAKFQHQCRKTNVRKVSQRPKLRYILFGGCRWGQPHPCSLYIGDGGRRHHFLRCKENRWSQKYLIPNVGSMAEGSGAIWMSSSLASPLKLGLRPVTGPSTYQPLQHQFPVPNHLIHPKLNLHKHQRTHGRTPLNFLIEHDFQALHLSCRAS